MKFAFIGTYPPQKCGIGTFTHNLIKSVADNFGYTNLFPNLYVIAVSDNEQSYEYPSEVSFVVNQNNQRDYVSAAKFINYNKADVCILDHEFGIFGGESGVYILSIVSRIEIPLIVTFHTVLKEPSHIQKVIVQELSDKAFKVIVMSKKAVKFLLEIYHIPEEKIEIIEHGVPVGKVFHRDTAREKFNFNNKTALFTFGLLNRNKGIETVIKALPKVVEKHKNILYVVLGNTHPKVLSRYGEEYREYLLRLVKDYGLEDYVYFYKNFVPEELLMEYLYAADIYVTPYLNEAQITSGTLSYAIGAGTAVISTPYWHAQELLADGRGILFDFHNHEQLGNILLDLLDNRHKIEQLREAATEYGNRLKWPKIGAKYIKVAKSAVENFSFIQKEKQTILDPYLLPDFTLAHIKRLTDDTGIVQHAKYGIPNLKEGYCLDDNARALLMTAMAHYKNKTNDTAKLMPIYLSYIHYMQNDDGSFRNFLSFSRNYLDEIGSEDSFGRTIWALGFLIYSFPEDSYHQLGLDIFKKSLPFFKQLKHLRGIANTIIGMSYYLKRFPEDEETKILMYEITYKLINIYNIEKSDDWNWFENILTYDNAIIPLAIFHAAEIFNDNVFLKVAIESSGFLESITMKSGYLTPVGSKGWFSKGEECADFAQQSVDVMGMVLLFFKAYQVTKEKKYLDKMFTSYMWYLGKNDLSLPVYDYESGGCNDGLEDYGLNKNQGAESTLSYLISHLTVLKAFELEYEYEK
ncbi:MAG: glycosyltransferase family 4 protein [Ignavibacteriae bacterium]|nr:glycosyltransferase family 4 protein [Ignavibacteriota bacterium]